MHRSTTSRAARCLTALDHASAALWYPVRNAIERATRLDRIAAKFEGRRRAKLAGFYRDVLSFVPAECAGSRHELEQEIAKLGA